MTTPPLYTTLLPNCGLALIALGLLNRSLRGRARPLGITLAMALVVVGVGTNLAILNANRLLKEQQSDAVAEVMLLSGER